MPHVRNQPIGSCFARCSSRSDSLVPGRNWVGETNMYSVPFSGGLFYQFEKRLFNILELVGRLTAW